MKVDEHEDLSGYLNGELSRDALPEALRKEAESFERIIAGFDRTLVTFPPWVQSAIMARVRMAEPSFLRRVWDWLVLPRPLQLSPLAAAAMVAVIVTTTLFIRPKGSGRGAPAPSDTSGMVTRFVFLAPHASRVAVTGDFANWDPEGIPLRRQGGGGWAAELNLPPGLYHYVFVIDGTEWHADPNASSSVDNGFGQRNSVLVVPLIRTN